MRIVKISKRLVRFLFVGFLMAIGQLASADWITFKPEKIEVLPNGNLAFWALTGGSGLNGCGSAAAPLRIDVDNYGVTTGAIKLFYSNLLAALIAGKSLDVSYYPLNSCRVDAITLNS